MSFGKGINTNKELLYHVGDIWGTIGRENANDIDLNRNFPDLFEKTKINAHQEKETQEVIKWLHEYPFVLSANLHGGSLVANYPYDDGKGTGTYSKCPDDATFIKLAESYSLVSYKLSRNSGLSY